MSAKVWEKDPKDTRLVRHIPTGMWYVRARRKGLKRLQRKTGYTDKGKAKTKAALMIAEWLGGNANPNHVFLFGDFAALYLEHLEKTKLKARTKEQARIYIPMLIKEMGHVDIKKINEGFFDEWLADYRTRVKRTTFADFAKYLRKTLRHAHKKEIINRMPEIGNPDAPKETGRVYTREEAKALLAACNPTTELQLRLCLQSFMRLREALHLTWDRVDLDAGLIHLRAEDVKTGSKTGKGRSFYVGPEILALLRKRRAGRRSLHSPFVFYARGYFDRPIWSNKTAWKSVKRRAGIEGKARWHDLRHTALTWALVEEKQNPLMVSAYAGVSLRTIQRVYLKVLPEHTREIASCIKV